MSAAPQVLAAEAARAAGAVVGRLLPLVLGVYLLVSGLRQRRDPSTPSRGTGRIVAGVLLLLFFLLGLAALSTTAATA